MGIPLKIASDKFPYVFLPEATGGNMGIPLKIAFNFFPTFSYRRQREATGGNGNTARAPYLDLNSLFSHT